MCGRRFGKSLIAMVICIQRMLKGEHCAYITPEFGLGKTFFKDVLEYIPKEIIRVDNKSELYIELITGGSLRFFSGEALGSMRGRRFHYIVIDEAAFISDLEGEWNTAIRPTLTDYKGGCLFISTPRGKNYFYSLYQKGINGEQDYQSFHFTTYDNPHIDKGEVDMAMKSIPQAQFNQEYLAIAGENAANPFGIDNIRNNTLTTLSTLPTVVYGIDLAKYSDWTVITGLDCNGHMSYFDRFQLPWTLTQQRIERLPNNIVKVVDSTGVGDVVFENLQLTCQNIRGFKFTTDSKPKMVYELIKDVEQGKVKFNQVTADEMMVFEYKYTSTGHIKFEAQSGFNDDCVMSLAIANKHKDQVQSVQNWKLYH